MSKTFFKIQQIMKYKVLQFWAKLDSNYSFTLGWDFSEKELALILSSSYTPS